MHQVVRCYPFRYPPDMSDVVFLLDMSDTDGLGGLLDGEFVDVSPVGHTVVYSLAENIGPETDDDIVKFGPTSALYRQSIDRLYLNSDSDMNFGANPFTVEGWFYWSSIPTGYAHLVGKWNRNGQRSWGIMYNQTSGQLEFDLSADGTNSTIVNYVWTPTLSTWYHICGEFNGSKYRLYVDGVMVASNSTPITLHTATGNLQFSIGAGANSTSTDRYFKGNIEDVRVCKVAVYDSDSGFSVPTASFPRS